MRITWLLQSQVILLLIFEKQSQLQHFVGLRGDCFGKNALAMTSFEFVNRLCKDHIRITDMKIQGGGRQ
jgi:hypothetical protein